MQSVAPGASERIDGLPDRIGALSGEGAFELIAAARALSAAGRDIIQLAIGEPDVATPPHIVEAALRSLQQGDTRYGPPEGLPVLREALAGSLASSGIEVDPSRIVVTPGAKSALAYALLAVVRPGDQVLVPDPGFPIYASLVGFAGGLPVPYPVPASGEPVPDDSILTRLTPRTRVIVVNSPHNPTGTVAGRAALERLAVAAERLDLTIVSDEVYGRLLYEPPATFLSGSRPVRAPSIAEIPGMLDRTIVIDGFSKTYAMTGWRLGYGVFPSHLARPAALLAVNLHSCVPGFVQQAGVAALRGPQDGVAERRIELRRRRDAAVTGLRAIPSVTCAEPAGAFYVFPRIGAALDSLGLSAAAFGSLLLAGHGVAVVPGTAFGERATDAIRIALTAPVVRLEEAIGRVRAFIELGAGARIPANARGRARCVSSGGVA